MSKNVRLSLPIVLWKMPVARLWGYNSVVECSLRMREVSGSNPDTSKFFFVVSKIIKNSSTTFPKIK